MLRVRLLRKLVGDGLLLWCSRRPQIKRSRSGRKRNASHCTFRASPLLLRRTLRAQLRCSIRR